MVLQAMLLERFADLPSGLLQSSSLVFHDCRWDQHLAVEVTEHPLRVRFGTVYGDNPESLWANFLHPSLDHAPGFAQDGWTDSAGLARIAFRNHSNGSPILGKRDVSFPNEQLEWFY